MSVSRRERLREATREEIKSTARQQMAEQGAASLSIRGIATKMGMSAPFLYHYYQNRDELVTALIVDAYTLQAEMLEQANTSCSSENIADHFLAIALAYREWAITHPTDFALLIGTPIPGYHAPEEVTLPAARRAMSLFLRLAQNAENQQRLRLPADYQEVPAELAPQFVEWYRQQGWKVSYPAMYMVLTANALIQGLLSLEIHGHTQYFFRNPADFYRSEILALLKRWSIL